MRRPEFIAVQSRHPHGFLGAIIACVIARETAADNKRAIGLLGLRESDHVIDIGTGHGRSLGVLAELLPRGLAVGVDNSEVALKIAKQRHEGLIRAGRVRVEYARSDALPFADASFDKAMAVHTLYFWNPAEPHLAEIARVLKPHGKFVLGFKPSEDKAATENFPTNIYNFRTTGVVEALLASTGFDICRSQRRRDVPSNTMVWIVARKR